MLLEEPGDGRVFPGSTTETEISSRGIQSNPASIQAKESA
jgi:hypothetical protein